MNIKKTTILGLTISLMSVTAAVAQNQVPGAIRQTENNQQMEKWRDLLDENYQSGDSTPALFEGELTDIGPQSILKIKARRKYFSAVVDSQFYLTSNLFLEEDNPGVNKTETTVWVNTLQAAFAPTAYDWKGGRLSPRIGFRHQWFNYGFGDLRDKRKAFDFDAQTLFMDVRYRC